MAEALVTEVLLVLAEAERVTIVALAIMELLIQAEAGADPTQPMEMLALVDQV